MSRGTCLGWAAVIVGFMGMGCNDSGTQPKHVQLTSFQSDCHGNGVSGAAPYHGAGQRDLSPLPSYQGPCLGNGEAARVVTELSPRSVRFTAGHDTLFVYHDSAFYNCCSKIRFDVEVNDSILDFIEVDTATNLCNCMCHFNLTTQLAGLAHSTYTARLWTAGRDSLLGEAVVVVPGTEQIWYESHCDTLTVHHDGDSANCCARFKFAFEQQGNVLTFTKVDTSLYACRCICRFDLVAQVSGLTAGEYSVRLRDAKADTLIDSAIVQIAACLR
jgi:hypothetical protein